MKLQLDNYFSIVHDLASKAEVWTSSPVWIEFSPNNICNLRCIMCQQADGLPVETMSTEEAVKFLDQVLPTASLLSPSALSEPMLGKMKLMLAKCREHDCFLYLYTNATLLDGKRFREMADRIHRIWISFDCSVPEIFERLRERANFDEVVQHIREILPLSEELNVPVNFVSVLMADNAPHIAELVDFLADLGAAGTAARVRVQPMLDNSERCADQDVHARYSEEEICAFLDAAVERAKARNMMFHVEFPPPFRRAHAPQSPRVRGILPDLYERLDELVGERYPHFCHMVASYLKVVPNGDVFPCCVGPDELKMGNIHEETVEEIWNGERYRSLRRQMNERRYPEACRNCHHLVVNPHFPGE